MKRHWSAWQITPYKCTSDVYWIISITFVAWPEVDYTWTRAFITYMLCSTLCTDCVGLLQVDQYCGWRLRFSFQVTGSHSTERSLGGFAKLQIRLPTASCLYVRMSVRMKQLWSQWTNFQEIWYDFFFFKSVENFQVWLKCDKNEGNFMWRPKIVPFMR